MASQGPLSPSNVGNSGTVGSRAWTNPNNAATSDNVWATANPFSAGQISNYLHATGFGFSIPAGDTILGIVVEVERSDGFAANNLKDHQVRIIKTGVGATEKADASVFWPAADAYKTYGSPTDLWGETWTPADINGLSFGVVLSAVNVGATNGKAQVDHIRITVYHAPPAPPPQLVMMP